MRRARITGSTLACAALACAALALLASAPACGGKVDLGTSGPSATGDSGNDGLVGSPVPDPTGPTPSPVPAPPTPTPTPRLCPGSSTTSPSGDACDPSRFRVVMRGKSRACFGLGDFCDLISIRLTPEEATFLPSEFRCGRPELGIVGCRLELDGNRRVDAETLDLACAASVVSKTAFVDCVVLD